MTEHRRDVAAPSRPPGRPAWQAAVLSFVLPGAGQALRGRVRRGLVVFLAVAGLAALIGWGRAATLAAPLAGIWLWNVWDAYRLATGERSRLFLPMLFGLIIVYGLGVQAAEVRPVRLVTGLPAVRPFLRALVSPELFRYPTEDLAGFTPFQVPCISPLPAPERGASQEPRVTTSVPCAAVGDPITVRGEGFFPNLAGDLIWVNPIGDRSRVLSEGRPLRFTTDDEGRFEATFAVPLAVPLTRLPPPGQTQTHLIRAEQHRPYGSPQPTETLSLVLEKIGETIALAFLATVLGVILAIPISFLAARNLMGGNPVTLAIYTVIRTILNIVRSIETLIWAIILAAWVGLGPFNGTMALLVHTIAALAKLYSEAIESIDPGPIEAVRATGANWAQVIVYAVLPQITPTFLSFTIYRWDINVRLSTVIGLVSDAGLGFLVIQWIRLNRLSSMATALIAIVLVVATLDYVSGWARERILVGVPASRRAPVVRRYATAGLLVAGVVALFAWSWDVAQIDLSKLASGASNGMRLVRAFLVPALFARSQEEETVAAPLPVPCDAGQPASAPEGAARVLLSVPCGAVGDPLIIQGVGLPSNTDVSVRWTLPDGAFLRVRPGCCTTDAAGTLRLETEIHPLMDTEGDEPGAVSITWRREVGGLQFSQAFKDAVNLSIVTLFMALLATTVGSLLSIPLSFFAARNITGHSLLGSGVYYAFRTLFNLTRSVEPLILALIAAAWVGAGPFAGTVALALWNIPNLGKLFSETIEEIDPGPVEAVTATGANRLQTLVYAVFPQLVPRFLAFILYQWDINIRMSTVIGFVGGGGIGQHFRLAVGLNQYGVAGMDTWAIVAMVWTMDFISAKARERLV